MIPLSYGKVTSRFLLPFKCVIPTGNSNFYQQENWLRNSITPNLSYCFLVVHATVI